MTTLPGYDHWKTEPPPEPEGPPEELVSSTHDALDELDERLGSLRIEWQDHDNDAVPHAFDQIARAFQHLREVIDG